MEKKPQDKGRTMKPDDLLVGENGEIVGMLTPGLEYVLTKDELLALRRFAICPIVAPEITGGWRPVKVERMGEENDEEGRMAA
jgi:hypothetical protein